MYHIRTGAVAGGTWCAFLCVATVAFAIHDRDATEFLRVGPSHTTFAGVRVDSWGRWALVMTYSLLSQVVDSVVEATLAPYITNVIRDHKTPRVQKGTVWGAHGIVLVYTLYQWLSSVFDVFLWITMQLQYMVPAIVVDLCLTVYFTNTYLHDDGQVLVVPCSDTYET